MKTLTRIKLPKMLFPSASERKYYSFLFNSILNTKSVILKELSANYNSLESEWALNRLDFKQDSFSSLLEKTFDKVKEASLLNKIYYAQKARDIALEVDIFQKKQFSKIAEKAFGINPIRQESWLEEEISNFSNENSKLITSLNSVFIEQTEELTRTAVRSGLSVKSLEKEIQEKFGVNKNRAKLIARDQVGKLNGQLNMLRQKDVQITTYVWRTSQDSRVRDAHKSREGKEFQWDKPPGDGHPGEPIRCRCYAEPVIDL